MNNSNNTSGEKKKKIALLYRLILIPALGLEIAAYLMTKGIIAGDTAMVNRFTAGGAIIVLVYLVINGLYSKTLGIKYRMDIVESARETAVQSAEKGQDK